MAAGRRWTIRDRSGHAVYSTRERWHHIIGAMNHPEMALYEERQKETLQSCQRRQDALNPPKYRYVQAFADLPEGNTHIVAIVLFRFSQGDDGKPNYSIFAQTTDIGPRSFPLTGLDELSDDLREVVLDILLHPAVHNILSLSAYTPSLADTIPISSLPPLSVAASISS
jgi:hypothetical protein